MPRPTQWRREFSAQLFAIQNELNRMFEEYWNPSRVGPGQAPPTDLDPSAWSPAIDVVETPQEVVVLVDLPGVDPSSIDLSVTGNVLSLRGERRPGDIPEGTGSLRERQFGAFHRQVSLPGDVNFEGIKAEAHDGVLKVRLPKQEEARRRTIPIKTAP
jgi:HSP20 family protein